MLLGKKDGMSEKPLDVESRVTHQPTDHNDAIGSMTQPTAKKSFVAGNEDDGLTAMQGAEDFLSILPLRAANLTPDLLRSEPGAL